MKYLLIIILLSSCGVSTKRNKDIIFPENNEKVIYQRIEIFNVETKTEREGKRKTVSYIISLVNSNKDTTIIEMNERFYKGLYWAETIEKDKKIIYLLSTDEYETVKLN